MTEKLYYKDSHIFSFDAKVLECTAENDGWLVVLDKTAFFPGGGGQQPDTGLIGSVRVDSVFEKDGIIFHHAAGSLEPGKVYTCCIDEDQRRRRMQNHSGEHIVSGIIHSLYGYENVGFHMGAEFVTIDISGELSADELSKVEGLANEAVRSNVPVKTYFPNSTELEKLQYRSKLDLKENVRIVEIEGIDTCACCAPHVERTGEVGFIKFLSSEKHRGGTRANMVCGLDALDRVNEMLSQISGISALLSAKRDDVYPAVERLLADRDGYKEALASAEHIMAGTYADRAERTEGNICVFADIKSESARRELVNMLVPKCGGMAAVFSPDGAGAWQYIIGSAHVDLRAQAKSINEAIGGRGGGRSEMISGRAGKTQIEIEKYFA